MLAVPLVCLVWVLWAPKERVSVKVCWEKSLVVRVGWLVFLISVGPRYSSFLASWRVRDYLFWMKE